MEDFSAIFRKTFSDSIDTKYIQLDLENQFFVKGGW